MCPAIYQPVCSTSGQTYSNALHRRRARTSRSRTRASAASPATRAARILGLACLDDNRCRFGTSQFSYPYPDAGGTCVAPTYCDAASRLHAPGAHRGPRLVGVQPELLRLAGRASKWQDVANGRFETAHPYANSTSVWKELALPAGAQALRLVGARASRLEANYDFLEVWTWKNGAWVRVKRFTGTAGPAATEEFPGRYHYLRFVSDSSVTRYGFRVDAQWR